MDLNLYNVQLEIIKILISFGWEENELFIKKIGKSVLILNDITFTLLSLVHGHLFMSDKAFINISYLFLHENRNQVYRIQKFLVVINTKSHCFYKPFYLLWFFLYSSPSSGYTYVGLRSPSHKKYNVGYAVNTAGKYGWQWG